MSCGRLRWGAARPWVPSPAGELEQALCGLERGAEAACTGEHLGRVSLSCSLLSTLPAFSSSSVPTKAQGSKDGKPKQKVIIADCGEYV